MAQDDSTYVHFKDYKPTATILDTSSGAAPDPGYDKTTSFVFKNYTTQHIATVPFSDYEYPNPNGPQAGPGGKYVAQRSKNP